MVRFIIGSTEDEDIFNYQFTFQYGQIYYQFAISKGMRIVDIYIPIWLDLLCQRGGYRL